MSKLTIGIFLIICIGCASTLHHSDLYDLRMLEDDPAILRLYADDYWEKAVELKKSAIMTGNKEKNLLSEIYIKYSADLAWKSAYIERK